MELFKFTTVKPSAVDLWTTIIKSKIDKVPGYSTKQVQFVLYCIFQLEPDFKKAKTLVNERNIIMEVQKLLGTASDVIAKLQPVKPGYPTWINEKLYTPYYLAKQLHHLGIYYDICFNRLFDRYIISTPEKLHITADYSAYHFYEYAGLTQWILDEVPIDYYFKHIVSFNPSGGYHQVSSKKQMIDAIKAEIFLEISTEEDNFLKPSKKVTIPEFRYIPEPTEEEIPF